MAAPVLAGSGATPPGRDRLGELRARLPRPLGLILGLGLSVLVVMPLIWLLIASFRTRSPVYPDTSWTLEHWRRLQSAAFVQATLNTLMFALVVSVLSVVIACLIAWVVIRTDAPFRGFIEILNSIPFVMSPFVLALGWLALLSPSTGLLNVFVLEPVFGFSVNVFSFWGIVLVTASFTVPTAYVFIATSLRSMDATLEEASRMAGGNNFSTLRRVTIPLMGPAIGSAMLITFVIASEVFSIPAVLGRPIGYTNLATLIYTRIQATPSDWAGAATAGSVLLVFAAGGTWWNQRILSRRSRYITVSGKMRPAQPIRLGKRSRALVSGFALGYGFITVVVPVGAVVMSSILTTRDPTRIGLSTLSLENYAYLLGDRAKEAVQNTLVLGLTTPIGLLIVAGAAAYFSARGRSVWTRLVDALATMPIAIPGLVLGVALLWSYFRVTWVPIYGSIAILLVGYLAKYLPYGYRNLSSAQAQIHGELAEASRISGASELTTYRRVSLPLLRPAMIYTYVMSFVLISRETTVAIILAASGVLAIAPLIWDLIVAGSLGRAYTVSVVQLILALIVMIVGQRFLGIKLRERAGVSE